MSESYQFEFSEEHGKMRLDKALSLLIPELSRSRITAIIKEGDVTLDGAVCTNASLKVQEGQSVTLDIPPAEEGNIQPENIPLDIVYEDDDLLVINKPVGLVVHPGAGNWTGTLVNALLHHCGDSLSGIGGVVRPGIVHRLDKDTSGLMLVAKNDQAHNGLAEQLQERTLSRTYHAIVLGAPMPLKGVVDAPIGRHSQSRLKMAITPHGKEARTHYRVLKQAGEAFSLLECKLESGRTHQIRVHMASLGHFLLGDPLYGPQVTKVNKHLKIQGIEGEKAGFVKTFPRQALHAQSIEFIHPRDEKPYFFEVSPPEDFFKLLNILSLNI